MMRILIIDDESDARHRKGTHMDCALSFLISAGIAAFGVWIIAYTIVSDSALAWMLTGLRPW
jgi:heme/copper-type cytochrome/quinol oxidase subunit 3